VVNDDGGTASVADFGINTNAGTLIFDGGNTVGNTTTYTAAPLTGLTAGVPYTLSEDNVAGYTEGSWRCTPNAGGGAFDSGTVTLALGEAVTCSILNNDDAKLSTDINAGHAGAWFNPDTSGQGQLIDIDAAEKFMFMAWFTYTDEASDNPFQQRWLTAQGNYSGDTAILGLYETLGGEFDMPQEVTTTLVGEVTLTFSSCAEGEMTYTIDDENLQGSVPLFRVIPGSENTC
jgi:hypothetical protein